MRDRATRAPSRTLASRSRRAAWSAGMASLACSPNDPSPIAALQRTSPCLSLRALIIAGTIWAAFPFRCGKRRTALIRSPSWDDFKSSISSSVDFSLRQPHASKQNNRRKRIHTRMAEALHFLSLPIGGKRFAARYGAEVLIGVGVDAAAEEMHGTVAEEE